MRWHPKIQSSGTGLAIVSAFGPLLGIPIPYYIKVAAFIIGLGMIIYPLLEMLIMFCWRLYRPLNLENAIISPLKIIFDPANPARRFWSLENNPNPNDPNRNFPPSWEYRIEVKNISSKTMKNVRVTVEHIGPLPQRPEQRMFDITKTHSYDINPDIGVLVPVVRFDPTPRPGLLAFSSALAYGPIKVTATAEDTPPVERVFQFDYQQTPAIFP